MGSHVDDQNAVAKLIAEGSRAAVIGVSLEGNVLFWNCGAELIFDIDRSRALNSAIFDLLMPLSPQAHAAINAAFKQALDGGATTVRGLWPTVGQPATPLLVSINGVRDSGGSVQLVAFHAQECLPMNDTESKSDLRLRGLLEASPDAMVIANRDGRILLVNGQALKLFGYKYHELLGQPVELLIPDDLRAAHPERRAQYFTQPRARTMSGGVRLHGQRKDGSRFPAEISLAPMQTEDGPLAIAAVRDVTERIRAEDKVLHLAALVNSSSEAIIGKSLTGLITSWNRGAEQIFGYSAEEMIGRSIMTLIPPDRVHEEAMILSCVKSGRSIKQYDTQRRRKDGTDIHVAVTISPINDANGNIIGTSKVARDISERMRTEEFLRKSQEATAAANRDMEAFSYSVAHDLRAPLRAIEGFSRVLLADHERDLEADAKHYLQRVHRSALSMSRLIDDLLALARVTRAEVEYRTVDLRELALAEISRLRELYPDRKVDFIGVKAIVVGDEGLLTILIGNLISNAWKFTGKRVPARIELGFFDRGDERVYYLDDNGAGFDMAYADKLFQPFQRLHHQDEFEGTGIGLATAARIVRRHGGNIWVEAALDRGATFYFTLGSMHSSVD